MFKPKADFFDRFDQSFEIVKNNFFNLIGLILGYKIGWVVIWVVYAYFFFVTSFKLAETPNYTIENFISDPTFISFILGGVVLFIVYLLFYIPIFVGTLNAIKKAVKGEITSIEENLTYGFSNFGNAIKTYWFIFVYVALIPCLIIIVGGILNIIGQVQGQWNISATGFWIIGLGMIYLLFNLIYRGIKATFGLYSANYNNNYTEKDFDESVKLSNDKWWRVYANVFFIGIIVFSALAVIGGITSSLIGIVNPGTGTENIPQITDSQANLDGFKILSDYVLESFKDYNFIYNLVNEIVMAILNITGTIFVTTFTYIFYLRLKEENELKEEV